MAKRGAKGRCVLRKMAKGSTKANARKACKVKGASKRRRRSRR